LIVLNLTACTALVRAQAKQIGIDPKKIDELNRLIPPFGLKLVVIPATSHA
jgi:hypothetical protein